MPRLASAGGVNFYVYPGGGGGEDGPTEYNNATMIFVQSTAPTGWTKDTTYDDYALRVVSGTPTTGGTLSFTSVFTTRPVTGTISTQPFSLGNTTLSTAEIPGHTHTYWGSTIGTGSSLVGPLSAVRGPAPTITGSTMGPGTTPASPGAHTHTQPTAFIDTFTGNPINLNIKYVDAILATYQV